MSIPKEPRQLMINLMYLVLTAMLALNVSAEVMNAFFTLDKGNTDTMKVVDGQLDATQSSLSKLLADDSKAEFRPIEPAIKQVREVSKGFDAFINSIRDRLIDESGDINGKVDAGDYKEDHAGELKYIRGKKNKDVTTRLLVEGYDGAEPLGPGIKAEVLKTRQELIDVYTKLVTENADVFGLNEAQVADQISSVANDMPFNIDDSGWQDNPESKAKSWSEFKFRQMPVAAVLPLLSQMQADLKASEANMVNDMAKLAGGKTISFDQFFPVVNADRSYVIGGESIKATVSVGTYSSSLSPENVRITANGRALKIKSDGTADLTIPASGTGQKTVPLTVSVKNPLTGKTATGEAKFTYEVGSRSVAVSADKMNVFYMGVDNPISVSASGVSSNEVRVNGSGPISVSGSYPTFKVTASKPGDAKISVSAAGSPLGTFDFRVKRIPDPVAKLGNKADGSMGNGEFKAQGGLIAWLEGFDFDAKCKIQGFKIVRVPKRQDPITVLNPGGKFNADAKRIVRAATPGDTYYFNEVKGRCPGDNAGRKLNSMVFQIR
jgi:gliding motility-associated protein GldM